MKIKTKTKRRDNSQQVFFLSGCIMSDIVFVGRSDIWSTNLDCASVGTPDIRPPPQTISYPNRRFPTSRAHRGSLSNRRELVLSSLPTRPPLFSPSLGPQSLTVRVSFPCICSPPGCVICSVTSLSLATTTSYRRKADNRRLRVEIAIRANASEFTIAWQSHLRAKMAIHGSASELNRIKIKTCEWK